jgi:hypothetical protein
MTSFADLSAPNAKLPDYTQLQARIEAINLLLEQTQQRARRLAATLSAQRFKPNVWHVD